MQKLFHMLAAVAAAITATFAPASEPANPTGGAPVQVVVAPPPAPATLVERLRELGEGFDGRAGIAIRDIEAGWTAGYNASALLPQQSVSKVWTVLAVYDAVDRGVTSLDAQVLVRREDLSVFHQPIRARVDSDGYLTTVEELIRGAITKSDNAANDILMRHVGGASAVQHVVDERRLDDIRVGLEQRMLQSQIAGMSWRPEFAIAWNFQHARATLPDEYRAAKLDAYLADPADGAAPAAIVDALARLHRGRLLSKASTDHYLGVLHDTETGDRRLRAGLKEGWKIAHKTGTGQQHRHRVTGWNDVGIVTAPDGRAYAIAVMIAETEAPVGERIALFRNAARALVEHHEQATAPEPETETAETGTPEEKKAA